MSETQKDIKLSQFGFWIITALVTSFLAGFGAWIHSTNTSINQVQIDIATLIATMNNLSEKVDKNLSLDSDINKLSARLEITSHQVELNKMDLYSRQGIRFNMPEYEKFVKPQIDSLLERVSNLERIKNDK